MRIISDVHGAFNALRRVASAPGPMLILGDLVNFVDYRTGDGMVADVFGREFVQEVARFRASGDYAASRALWLERSAQIDGDVRSMLRVALEAQYVQMNAALGDAEAFVTYGNVDTPSLLRAALPVASKYVDGTAVDIEGWRVGFAGGGSPSPLGTPGEVSEGDMEAKLAQIGAVDILCSHLPPAVEPLRFDTVADRSEGASLAILAYLRDQRPKFHYFGDVHQPRASQWWVGGTLCRNVGYFRATGRSIHHAPRFASRR